MCVHYVLILAGEVDPVPHAGADPDPVIVDDAAAAEVTADIAVLTADPGHDPGATLLIVNVAGHRTPDLGPLPGIRISHSQDPEVDPDLQNRRNLQADPGADHTAEVCHYETSVSFAYVCFMYILPVHCIYASATSTFIMVI
jgi:hypothetical protein